MKTLISSVVILLVAGLSAPAHLSASDTNDIVVSVQEWNVPFDERWSRDPFVGPDGLIYFVGQWTHYVGWFDPATEEFGHVELESGATPHSVVVSEDGTAWYTALLGQHIGKIDLSSGEITQYEVEERLNGPHTIRFDEHGNFWFTSISGDGIGYFDVSSGEIRAFEVSDGGRPYGMAMDPSGTRPWVALFGANRIATLDPETMQLEEIELPREEIRARRLNVTSDGNVWVGDYTGGSLVRYEPSSGTFSEWEMPHGDRSAPYAVLVDDKDRIWLSASGFTPNRLIAFDSATEEFVASLELETDRGVIRNMDFDPSTRSIWFGTDMGYIGRVVID